MSIQLDEAISLQAFQQRYEQGKEEIAEYLLFVENSVTLTENLQNYLKANFWLMLYNLIEGTVRNGMQAMHTAFNGSENFTYVCAHIAIKDLWIKYKENKLKILNERHLNLREILDDFLLETPIRINYNDFIKNQGDKEFSGNLDFEEIAYTLQKYGVRHTKPQIPSQIQSIQTTKPIYFNYVRNLDFLVAEDQRNIETDLVFNVKSDLRNIKEFRNKLAHGNILFSEGGSRLRLNPKRLKFSAFAALDFFVDNVSFYIQNEHYKITLL